MRKLLFFGTMILLISWIWPDGESSDDWRISVVPEAEELVGAPYRGGGKSPSGFDCSGLTWYVFQRAGFEIPRDSRSQAKAGTAVERGEEEPGDLIFFKGRSGSDIGHVGIVADGCGDSVLVIHACSRGVVKEPVFGLSYYRRRFMGIRRM